MGPRHIWGRNASGREGPFLTQQARLGVSEVLALGTWLRVRTCWKTLCSACSAQSEMTPTSLLPPWGQGCSGVLASTR